MYRYVRYFTFQEIFSMITDRQLFQSLQILQVKLLLTINTKLATKDTPIQNIYY